MNIQKTRFCFYAILLIVLSLLASCIDDNEPVDKQETVTLYVSANMGQTSGLTGTMHDCMLVKEKGDDTWNTWTLEGIKGFKSEIKNVLRFFIPDFFAWTKSFLLNHILLYSLLFPFQSIQTYVAMVPVF